MCTQTLVNGLCTPKQYINPHISSLMLGYNLLHYYVYYMYFTIYILYTCILKDWFINTFKITQLATGPVRNPFFCSCTIDRTAVGSGSVAGLFSVHATGLSNTTFHSYQMLKLCDGFLDFLGILPFILCILCVLLFFLCCILVGRECTFNIKEKYGCNLLFSFATFISMCIVYLPAICWFG
jgi:hypothetical protein